MDNDPFRPACRRVFLGVGMLTAVLGVPGCGESEKAPPPARGQTGTRARLEKFKSNAEAASKSKQKK